jgi:hypothetical protein
MVMVIYRHFLSFWSLKADEIYRLNNFPKKIHSPSFKKGYMPFSVSASIAEISVSAEMSTKILADISAETSFGRSLPVTVKHSLNCLNIAQSPPCQPTNHLQVRIICPSESRFLPKIEKEIEKRRERKRDREKREKLGSTRACTCGGR